MYVLESFSIDMIEAVAFVPSHRVYVKADLSATAEHKAKVIELLTQLDYEFLSDVMFLVNDTNNAIPYTEASVYIALRSVCQE